MSRLLILLMLIINFPSFGQTIISEIPPNAFNHLSNTYNYTSWDSNFNTGGVAIRKFSNQSSSYALSVDYTNLNIHSLDINNNSLNADDAFALANNVLFPTAQSGNIDYAILQGGNTVYEKSNIPTAANPKDSQLSEYGTWLNRRFVSTKFTNSAPVEFYYTGVEFTNWHNRFKVTFHVRPTADITNGQLRLSVDIPSVYNNTYQTGAIYAFAEGNDAGFAVQGGTTAATTNVVGNTITVTTTANNLLAGTSYEVSILVYAIPTNLSTTYVQEVAKEAPISIVTNQTLPNSTAATVNYVADEGVHFIDIPRYGMGYTNCTQESQLQNIEVSLENTSNVDKVVRLCFRQIPAVNVVGFNSMIRNDNGDPSGYPLQVSKNWHNTTPQLYSGSWIKEYTEIPVPANTTINFDYTRTGAKWGTTYGAFSHQLSVVGAGVPRGGWLEAGLGSFGENITHSPDYVYGNSNVCDYRPFLVTNQAYGGGSVECSWTGNVGGMDMWVYENGSNQRIYQSEVKTKFQRYSPNLTETSISAYSSDQKLKLDYTFYLNRSDDFTRVYYKIKVKALDNVDFNRFDLFQMGGDRYNLHRAQTCMYGDDAGTIGQFVPTNDGSNDYTNAAIPLTGTTPWIWAGDGISNDGSVQLDLDTNNGMVVRAYNASFNGVVDNTPYFRERSSSIGFSAASGTNPTSYCIVPPPSVTSFVAGDSMELLVETMILPKQAADYYGPNANFAAALAMYGNSVDLFLRELTGNTVVATSPTNVVNSQYPISVMTNNNTALVTLEGGKGFVPLRFTGVSDITDPQLWKANETCWEIVDQSNWGKDFWQADFNTETGLFELVYNVDQDTPNDDVANIKYYLGPTPPEPSMVIQTKLYTGNWSINPIVPVGLGDSVIFAPQVTELGITSPGAGAWSWTGPNNYMANTRFIKFEPVTYADIGVYTCTYTDPCGCTVSEDFELVCADTDVDNVCDFIDQCLDGDDAIDMNNNGIPDACDSGEVALKVMLEGAFDASLGMMHTKLNTANLLPFAQPYNIAPYNYTGTEILISIPTNMVDWVLVEARSGLANTMKVEQQAAILLNNGDIVDVNGNTLVFDNLTANTYFVVRHRNHLDIMTATTIPKSLSMTYDFTTNMTNAYGSAQLKAIPNGLYAMYAGDDTQDHVIQISDYDYWRTNPAILNVYDLRDMNMDGTVQATDYDIWVPNRAKLGQTYLSY